MIRRWTGYLLWCAVVFLIVPAGFAGDAGRETPFSLGVGGRALGMGAGFTSLASDATAIYYNPAQLSYLEYQEASFMHSVLFEGTTYDFASWVYPISASNGIGVGFMRVGTGEITRREDYADRGKFDYSTSQFVFSYGRNFGRPFGVGVGLKIVNQSLEDYSDYGIGLDVGLSSKIGKHLSLGLIAREIIPAELELDKTVEEMPWSVTAGVSLAGLTISELVSVTASVDLEKPEDRALKGHVGVELLLYNSYALRCGWDRDNFTFGAGLSHGWLGLNYAYKLQDYIDDTHHFSLSFLLGRPVSERTAVTTAITAAPLLTSEERELLRLKERADSFFRRFQLDSALACYKQAYDVDSTDEEVAIAIHAIEHAQRIQVEQEGKLREAELDLQRYMRNYYVRANLFYAKKYYSAALDLLDLIFDVEPENVEALELKRSIHDAVATEIAANLDTARIAEQDGQTIKAVEAYNRVLELDPDNREVIEARQRALATLDLPQQLNLGIGLFEKGQLSEARVQFEVVLSIRPGEPLALEYLKRIKENGAVRVPATLESLQKDDRIWQHYLNGLRHVRNGDYQKAIEEWERVLEVYPDNPNTLDNIEQARLRLGSE